MGFTHLIEWLSQGQEGIEFQDVLCQMVDMICPLDSQSITLSDLTKPNKRHISGESSFGTVIDHIISRNSAESHL